MSSAHNKYLRERIALLEMERESISHDSDEHRRITADIEALTLKLLPEPRRRKEPRLVEAIIVTLIGGVLIGFLAFHFGVSR